MPFGPFSAATVIGAGLWCTVLAMFGQQVIGDQPRLLDSPGDLIHAVKAKLLWVILAVVVVGVAYAVMVFFRSRATEAATDPEGGT
jgi:membrane protein DedA with SNARE-associated domain